MTLSLQQRIQHFYDQSSGLWERIWGEHMHHGYYGADGRQKKERRQAQIDLIDELLRWGEVTQAQKILDVGCGIGGSSLYLAEKFGAEATGITLSPVQAQRARERAKAAGLPAQFEVADALHMPFEDASFDFVWSLESGEHMPDKVKFVQECFRVLKPGGRFIMATWCHRPIAPPEAPLTVEEEQHLAKIYEVYCLPHVISLPEYAEIAQSTGFQNLRTEDWSTAVAPFWDVVIDSAFTPAALVGLVQAGWTTVRAALSLGLMQRGYQTGLVRFGLLTGTR
ncbi:MULTISPECIES: methyltransferase domain-containing protein [unclassified Leptolyngbya]|uniref:methyltransferase domain-containing protein n=1 Tax=unclassified Leptolyngbya TaxID=2650499 RepID=UPI001684D7DA|nr:MULTISPECIES: methyltransferase domain-containing protein [unclassified Leptolyngbya]MBD1910545.1 methyltransferase domain-containing protein [Leptolyngbya sp. FACHB-8]MBD2153916.1 methyltransferase domain-containing protein [Leptolyngbya sp. FACHB-16]